MTTPHTSGAADLSALFREALAWGMTYGPEIPLHQWADMRESMVKQYTDRALAAGQAVAPTEPTSDELRAIAREARNSSGSASDDCGPAAYVLYGWRAAMSKVAPPAMDGEDAEDAARWRMLPAFFEEYQIDAMKLYRDIDAARAAQKESKP